MQHTSPQVPHPQAEQNARAYDRIAHCYDGVYTSVLTHAGNAVLARWIERHLGPVDEKELLDMGCGTGLLPEILRVHPDRYVGLDPSVGMLDRARGKFPHLRLVQAYQEDTGFEDASFDSVASLFGVFSYSPEPERVVAEIGRVLKPGGKYLVMALGSRFCRNPKMECCNRHGVTSVFTCWSKSKLKRMFSTLGPCKAFSFSFAPGSTMLHPLLTRTGLRLESALLGPVLGGLFRYQIVTGVRS
ncbi:MAG: class I SAM-dependent methyltransferase [Desulfovibrio sp.]|nr:MAG: class I SAM-dependent methyltransferase [Desulfovibrio sp.]